MSCASIDSPVAVSDVTGLHELIMLFLGHLDATFLHHEFEHGNDFIGYELYGNGNGGVIRPFCMTDCKILLRLDKADLIIVPFCFYWNNKLGACVVFVGGVLWLGCWFLWFEERFL